ncbi:MAG TPA: hypothetical protein VGR25_12465 [bacterium]|jgi:hypothetical protein|nr:hypothetical protein [bacterium]HEV8702791.1 hypothetical protein [Candidatus Polarisedimenticolia bacterium]
MIEPNPFETLRQIAGGYCLSRGLHVVANLAVADKLDETPRTAAELATSVGAHPEALGRVLRLLSAHGVFESCDGKFRHSPASRMLRADHPQSMRDYVRMFGLPPFWATFGEYVALFDAAGFSFTREIETGAGISILEGA